MNSPGGAPLAPHHSLSLAPPFPVPAGVFATINPTFYFQNNLPSPPLSLSVPPLSEMPTRIGLQRQYVLLCTLQCDTFSYASPHEEMPKRYTVQYIQDVLLYSVLMYIVLPWVASSWLRVFLLHFFCNFSIDFEISTKSFGASIDIFKKSSCDLITTFLIL
jgi:hypothetical protein